MKPIDVVTYDMFQCTDTKPENVSSVKITEIAKNDFKVESADFDAYMSGFLYYVRVHETDTEYKLEVYRTAYGDTGIIVRDKNLNFLRHEDLV